MLRFAGRALLSSIFIAGGLDTFQNPEGRGRKAGAKLPLPNATLAARLNGGGMVVAGVAMALGIRPKLAAAALAGLLIPTTYVGHPYWEETDAMPRAMQRTHFVKNLGLLGGLLLVVASSGDHDGTEP